jgi:hypothetical protein
MEELEIKAHIEGQQKTQRHLHGLWANVVFLNNLIGLSDSTMDELKTKISTGIAQCEKSIQDHEKHLKNEQVPSSL